MKPHFVLAVAVMALSASIGNAAPAKPAADPTTTFQVPGPAMEQKAESALTTTIAAFEAGTPNYDDIEGAIVDAVKAQKDALVTGLKGLGPLKSLEYAGYSPQGVWRYKGQFASGKADLMIGFGPNGKIQTLWFRPLAA